MAKVAKIVRQVLGGVLLALGVGVIAVFFVGCKEKSQATFVATNFVCFDALRAVRGGEGVRLLIKPGLEAHTFDPTVFDIAAIQNCALFVYIGGESDEWVRTILKSAKSVNALRLLDIVDTLPEAEGGVDEHVWLSPANEVKIIEAVWAAVNSIEPTSRKATEQYIERIKALDEKMRAVAPLVATPLIIADRFPFAYFVNYYGLSYIAAFSGCSSAVDATPAVIAKMVDAVEKNNQKYKASTIYHIELGNEKLCNILAAENGAKVRELQSMQTLSKSDFDNGATYADLFERNIEALRE